MAKTYPDVLAEWAKGKAAKKSRQDKHVVAFLAAKSDVQAALDAGYAMKTIWEHMRECGRLQYRYETFTQHVKRHIKAAPIASPLPGAGPRPPPATQAKNIKPDPKPPSSSTPIHQPPKMSGFTFDATPNKEDLL